MKKRYKIAIIIIIVLVLNMPLVFLSRASLVSFEQPYIGRSFENVLDITTNDFVPRKQVFTAKENNLSGISIAVANNDFAGKQFELRVYDSEDAKASNPIRDVVVKNTHPDLSLTKVTVKFSPIADSKDKQLSFVFAPINTKDQEFKQTLNSDESLLNIRPLYATNDALGILYYRLSQYKSSFLKTPFLIFYYLAYNLLILLLFWNILGNNDNFHKKRPKLKIPD